LLGADTATGLGRVAATHRMTDTQPTIAGKTLGRYQLLASIARGGMGQVWLGRLQGARGFAKLVAIKTILGGVNETGRFERMLLEEARIAALIHHANVVQTIELGEDDGTLYLVMEWVDGEPLSAVLGLAQERGGLPIGVAANLIAQTLRGLHAAHELCDDSGASLGVVHRDVSPHNVLITYSGVAKLLDFGIAKATKRSNQETVTGEVKGKYAYMAPEQVLGTAMDRRTDLFAVGIMLYTMTAGRHPFKHHNDAGVLHAITSEKPADPPSRFVADYPPALEAVVMKAIDKNIEQRFATAEEMRLALEQAVPAAVAANDARVRSYIGELLQDRAAARREAIRRTLLRADTQTPSAGSPVFVQSSQSASSLRAVTRERRTTTSSGSSVVIPIEPTVRRVDSRAPLVRSRKRYQAALLGALAVAGFALVIAARAVTSKPTPVGSGAPRENVTQAAEQPAAAPLAVAAPEPPTPLADAGADEVRNVEPPQPADPRASPASPKAKNPKAKRGTPKSSAPEDLIAPDYAQ
jgi:eukaryotic-like serine/threonine-protein kinase